MNILCEEEIEYKVERFMDWLDEHLMNNKITHKDYDIEIDKINRWAKNQYSKLDNMYMQKINKNKINEDLSC